MGIRCTGAPLNGNGGNGALVIVRIVHSVAIRSSNFLTTFIVISVIILVCLNLTAIHNRSDDINFRFSQLIKSGKDLITFSEVLSNHKDNTICKSANFSSVYERADWRSIKNDISIL